jgi:apolipoprotein N-acyltransferase
MTNRTADAGPGARLERLAAAPAGWGLWRRRGVLLLLGALTTLGLPPADLWPIAFLTLPVLVWMLEAAKSRRTAFGTGWWFAFGYFLAGWYWISNALLVFSSSFWWMVPFALVGLPAAMAVYYGLAALGVHLLTGGGGPARRLARVLLLAGLFALADVARGTLLTGFPWNPFGYLWSGTEALSQGAALLGVFGLGVLVLLSGLMPALAAGARRPMAVLLLAGAIPAAVFAGGTLRLAGAPDLAAAQADPANPGLRVVQPNIPQAEKWPSRYRARNFQLHAELSREDRPDWVRAVLWPETAAAFLIEQETDYRTAAGAFAAPPGGYLITGAPRRPDRQTLHNSIVAVDPSGTIRFRYDKAHLVPFGEYVPLGRYMPFGKVTVGAIDYSPGPGPQTVALPGLPPVSPLICYEVIFPAKVTAEDGPRPAWILNATNDAWYGATAGPHQHLQHARMRAVEQGLPLVRPASTGISAVFDSYGREIARIPLNESGYVDFRLPPPAAETFFARYGSLMLWGMLILLCSSGLMATRS